MAGQTDVRVSSEQAAGGRRRSFIASSQKEAAASIELPQSDEGLPVLTDIVPAEVADSEAKIDRVDEAQVTLLASEIAQTFEQQLVNELPALLEAALLNVGDKLRDGIRLSLETALQEFIARRK